MGDMGERLSTGFRSPLQINASRFTFYPQCYPQPTTPAIPYSVKHLTGLKNTVFIHAPFKHFPETATGTKASAQIPTSPSNLHLAAIRLSWSTPRILSRSLTVVNTQKNIFVPVDNGQHI